MDIFTVTAVAIAAAFMWIGMTLSISFLEAWLKFRAPGVTTAIGLGIGRLVFGALNKIEWLLTIVMAVCAVVRKAPLSSIENTALLTVVGILVAQTVWLLPTLNRRAHRVMNNQPVKASGLHVIFVAAELVKITLLFTVGLSLLSDL